MPTREWGEHEAMLQSYRSDFLSSQSIMLAVGALVLDKSAILTYIVSALGLIQIYILNQAIRARAKVITCHRNDLPTDKEFINKYVHNYKFRKKVNKKKGIKVWTEGRVKFDIVVPAIMTLMWLLYITYAYSPSWFM